MSNLPNTLPEWLALIESRHAETVINMGLDRVRAVKERMALAFKCPVIMVAGTNGKGSTCAMLESILLQGGYRVGLYIKPHFLHFNERARLNGDMASDQQLVESFNFVERARGDISLTYFEFTTLAIMHLMSQAALDVVILEVGLGGRLDAVNVIDADVSIVTSVDIDHVDYLGGTREQIGFEKAGIFRTGKVAICSDPVAPQALIDHAMEIGADLWLMGRDFNYAGDKQQWNYGGRSQRRNSLAYPGLRGANQLLNACAALAALEALKMELPVGAQEVRTGLVMVELPGRFQVLPGRPTVIYDVAHNPHAAAALAQNVGNMGFSPYTFAVFGSMHDKDIDGVIKAMAPCVDHWCLSNLPSPRAATASELAAKVQAIEAKMGEKTANIFDDPGQAFANAMSRAGENDRIVVFGSFLTVAGVMASKKILTPLRKFRMGLLSKFGKDKQDAAGEDSGYYRAQDDRALDEKARSKRASSAGADAPARRNSGKNPQDPVLPEKKRARRRLVGAIALALAVAIGLPMLLDSEPKSSVSDIAISMPSKDKPGEPLNGGPAAAPAPASASRTVAPVAAAGASLDKGEEIVSVPAKPAVTETAKPPKAAEPKATDPKVAKAEVKHPEPKPEPKKPEPKPEAKPAHTDDARAMAILEGKPAEAAPSTKYVIKVGAFAAKEKVDELQRKLSEAGIKSYAQKVNTANGELTSVRVGPFPNKDEAEKVKAKLGKLGLSGSLTPA